MTEKGGKVPAFEDCCRRAAHSTTYTVLDVPLRDTAVHVTRQSGGWDTHHWHFKVVSYMDYWRPTVS